MKKFLGTYFPVLLLLISVPVKAQVEKIRFGKSNVIVYFFQKGAASDTIVKNKSDLFYLLVPDSLKPQLAIFVENGRLLATGNDSLVKFDFLKGLNYESGYVAEEPETPRRGRPANKKWILRAAINGTAPAGDADKIVIRVRSRQEENVLIENVFYYK